MTQLLTAPPSTAEAATLAARFAGATPEELIRWASETFGSRLALSCSFGGASGMVLLDMGLRINPDMAVVYVDTDYLFPETHSTVQAVEQRYGIRPRAFRSNISTEQQADMHGAALWERDPDACCALRKVEPMRRALAGYDAYLTGLRRDQAESRRDTPAVQWDAKFGLFKINPLVDWDEKQTWAYIVANDLPYNPLHDQGYPSIGCTNCTRAVKPGEDIRAGRWSGSDKIECGLHVA